MNELILTALVIGIISLFFGLMGMISELVFWALGWEEEEKEKRLTGGHPVKRTENTPYTVYHRKGRVSR